MLVNYKLHLRKNATYYCYLVGRECEVIQDLWTTIKLEKGLNDFEVKYYGKANLMKQVAIKEWNNVRVWKKIVLDNSDIEVVRE